MKITTTDIVREIRQKSNGTIKTSDINDTLKYLEDVISEEITKGNDVKLRSLFVIKSHVQENFKGYDGLNKKYYVKPRHIRVSIKTLKKLSNLGD